MSDPIDREALIDDLIQETYTTHRFCFPCKLIFDAIREQPSAEPKGRLEQAISGKTAEEVYEILHWLMLQYAKQYTDSRGAVIEWLKGEDMRGEQDG